MWRNFDTNGYLVVKNIFSSIEIEMMRESIQLDNLALQIESERIESLKGIDGLNSSYGWNKRCWGRIANIFPVTHPQIYRYYFYF
jgi:hypothetical protein